MCPKYPSGFYDEKTLTALAQAFREVWTTVAEDDPSMDFGTSEILRQTIAHLMLELASQGVLSVDELRDRALAEVIPKPKPANEIASAPRLTKSRQRSHRAGVR